MRALRPLLAWAPLVVGVSTLAAPASGWAQRWPAEVGLAAEVSPLPPSSPPRTPRETLPLPQRVAELPPRATRAPPETPSSSARLQLVIGQGIHGATLGFTLAHLFLREPSSNVGAGFTLGGAAVGVVTSLVLSRDGISPGQAAAVTYGSILGGLSGGLVALAQGNDADVQAVAGVLTGGFVLGTAGGIYWATRRPLSGEVEFASSMALWGTFLGSHLYLATSGYGVWTSDPAADKLRVYSLSTLGWTAASLTAGLLLARRVAPGADEMRWINVSALVGWALGGGAGALLADENGGEGAYALGSMGGFVTGAVVGFVWAAYRSPRRAPQTRAGSRLLLAPGGLGSPLGLNVSGSF